MKPKLAITTAVLLPKSELIERCVASHLATCKSEVEDFARYQDAESNLGVTGSLQRCYLETKAPIIAFIHSDVEVHEQGWDERVLREFDDPQVGVVGFGGALQLGENDIYKTPYQLIQLRRLNYLSNQTDWQTHGHQFEGVCDVATLDGFALIVRRSLLLCIDGWPVERYPFHNYDNWLCLQAAKYGYRARLVGVKCTHHGGATSTTAECQKYWESLGTSDQEIHTRSHTHLYEDGRGWLPLRAK